MPTTSSSDRPDRTDRRENVPEPTPTTLNTWDLRDPAALLHTVHHGLPLTPGRTVLALVRHPSTRQQLLDVVVVSDRQPPPSEFSALRELMKDAAGRLFAGRTAPWPPTHAFVTIVARNGNVVFTRDDLAWSSGLLYSAHLQPAYLGDLILVTEHGWRCDADSTAGRHPALVAA